MATETKRPVGRPKGITKPKKTEKREITSMQLPNDVHKILKDYCDIHGYRMNRLVANLIIKHCK
jgi:hypothetical protein